jgi:hypothetical protein
LFRYLGYRRLLLLAALAGLAAAGTLLYQPLGLKLFGHMDDEWRDLIFRRSPHCFPVMWEPTDWVQIGGCFIILIAAAGNLPCQLALFCRAVVVAGLAGLASSFLAAELPYALLLQGQPFRLLWLVQFLAIPLGFLLVSRWAREPRPLARLMAVLLFIGLVHSFVLDARTMIIILMSAPVCALLVYWRSPEDRPDWYWLGLVGGLLTGMCVAFVTTVSAIVRDWDGLVEEFEPLLAIGAVPSFFDKGLVLLACTFLACQARHWFRPGIRLAAATALLGFAYQGLHFGLPQTEWYCRTFREDQENMRFVQEVLARMNTGGRRPTVYWAVDIKHLWLELQVNCYFSLEQTPNNIFSRGQALEADRRAHLVMRFELDRLRKLREPGVLPEREWRSLRANFHTDGADAPAERDDLVRLCREEGLDYVISNSPLGPEYCASNSKVFVYAARAVSRR